jgi:phage terminase small subunit
MTKAKKPVKKAQAGGSRLSKLDKTKLFLEAFLSNNGNLRKSALAMGCSDSAADKAGQRMSKTALFMSMLEERRAAVYDDLEITTERILKERARLAFFDPRKLFDKDGKPIPIHELDDDTAAALAGLDVMEEYAGSGDERVFIGYTKKYKLADKNASLTSLEKQKGMYEKDNEQSRAVTKVVMVPPKKAADD